MCYEKVLNLSSFNPLLDLPGVQDNGPWIFPCWTFLGIQINGPWVFPCSTFLTWDIVGYCGWDMPR